jgi:hypothetical protein
MHFQNAVNTHNDSDSTGQVIWCSPMSSHVDDVEVRTYAPISSLAAFANQDYE